MYIYIYTYSVYTYDICIHILDPYPNWAGVFPIQLGFTGAIAISHFHFGQNPEVQVSLMEDRPGKEKSQSQRHISSTATIPQSRSRRMVSNGCFKEMSWALGFSTLEIVEDDFGHVKAVNHDIPFFHLKMRKRFPNLQKHHLLEPETGAKGLRAICQEGGQVSWENSPTIWLFNIAMENPWKSTINGGF